MLAHFNLYTFNKLSVDTKVLYIGAKISNVSHVLLLTSHYSHLKTNAR